MVRPRGVGPLSSAARTQGEDGGYSNQSANGEAAGVAGSVWEARADTDGCVHAMLKYAQSTQCSQILSDTSNYVTLAHQHLTRYHGRERTDQPQAAMMLSKFPQELWTDGACDGRFCGISPPYFELDWSYIIAKPRYYTKPEAAAGIADTLRGLSKVGVLEKSVSAWNTPLLPAPKSRW